MPFERFTDRKVYAPTRFVATLTRQLLRFNDAMSEQVVKRATYADLFFDRRARRVGVRFLDEAPDTHSLPLITSTLRKNRRWQRGKMAPTRSQISMVGFVKHYALQALLDRPLRAEMQHDPVRKLWWFDITRKGFPELET